MTRVKALLVSLAVLAGSLGAPPASAEWMLDLYLGGAFTETTNATATLKSTGPTEVTLESVAFDPSFSLGGRVGYWFEAAPHFGLALDVSHFRPTIGSQTVTAQVGGGTTQVRLDDLDIAVTALSFDVMLRLPLRVSQAFPKGQLQPYFAIGPAIFIATVHDSSNFVPSNQSQTDTFLQMQVAAGAAWHVLAGVALFAEYRFMFFSPDFEFRSAELPQGRLSLDINTHHVLAGISFRF